MAGHGGPHGDGAFAADEQGIYGVGEEARDLCPRRDAGRRGRSHGQSPWRRGQRCDGNWRWCNWRLSEKRERPASRSSKPEGCSFRSATRAGTWTDSVPAPRRRRRHSSSTFKASRSGPRAAARRPAARPHGCPPAQPPGRTPCLCSRLAARTRSRLACPPACAAAWPSAKPPGQPGREAAPAAALCGRLAAGRTAAWAHMLQGNRAA